MQTHALQSLPIPEADPPAHDEPAIRTAPADPITSGALSRGELFALIALSVVLHVLGAVQVARARSAPVQPRAQQVVIEMVRPPVQPPVVPAQAAQPERPRVARAPKPQSRPAPKLEEIPPPAEAPPAPDLPALPTGDDPILASSAGQASAAEAPPAPPPPAPVVAAQEGANYLKNPRPAYPELALRRGWQGDVQLRVQVSPAGRPLSVIVARSSGRELLDQAAIAAVRGWTFVPARQGAEAVAGWVNVPIVFHLQ
jgi:protein TonB